MKQRVKHIFAKPNEHVHVHRRRSNRFDPHGSMFLLVGVFIILLFKGS